MRSIKIIIVLKLQIVTTGITIDWWKLSSGSRLVSELDLTTVGPLIHWLMFHWTPNEVKIDGHTRRSLACCNANMRPCVWRHLFPISLMINPYLGLSLSTANDSPSRELASAASQCTHATKTACSYSLPVLTTKKNTWRHLEPWPRTSDKR